jgi:hypothetical protein
MDLLRVIYHNLAKVRSPTVIEVAWTAADAAAIDAKVLEKTNFEVAEDAAKKQTAVLCEEFRRSIGPERHHYMLGQSHLIVAGGRPTKAILEAMGRAIAAFNKTYTVYWFMNGSKRTFPPPGQPVERKHINGGYCMACEPDTIVIYRREDALRVLVHELQHATCMDNHKEEEPIIEAKTEAWAEIFYAMMAAVRLGMSPDKAWNIQSAWSAAQNARLKKEFGVNGPSDYAWRYTVGKEGVFVSIGLPLPAPKGPKPMSLQLGAPQLDVV